VRRLCRHDGRRVPRIHCRHAWDDEAQANARLAELVDRVDLADVWNQRIESLSKGFKRRVAIAQALVHDPDALILDEPTDGLDPIQKYEMRDLIRSIAPQKAIIISTHILEEVEAVCTRAIIIAKGRMLADATPAELLARAPSHGTLALALATADPQGAIDILSKHPGVGQVDVVQRVNGVTRIAIRTSKTRPSTDEITSLLGRSNIAVTDSTSSAPRSTTCSARSQATVGRTDMRPALLVFRREFAAYFSTPVAAVFLIVFLALAAGMTFLVSGFFDRGQADLSGFFFWHPWLFLVLMPAIAMRLWAEERRSGTIELLMTLPVEPWQIVVGKWLAAWAFAAIALVLTMPLWITVNVLGSPDNGVILSSYIGSWLMAGAFLALARPFRR